MSKLIIVGSGMKSIAHLTQEAKHVIQHADKVLYLVNEDYLKTWIIQQSKQAESLEPIYFQFAKRVDAYYHVTTYIIQEYQKFNILCVVFYGHPCVFAQSALNAVKQIQLEGGNATILPAISSMDCLFSDLQIDPGDQGCFMIDATELLVYERALDIHAHVILWQIANLGMHTTQQTQKFEILCDYLHRYYEVTQPICIYEAAMLPTQKPRIEWLLLQELPQIVINPVSTLYIKPLIKKNLSKLYLTLLDIDTQNFHLSAESNTPTE